MASAPENEVPQRGKRKVEDPYADDAPVGPTANLTAACDCMNVAAMVVWLCHAAVVVSQPTRGLVL